MKIQTLQTRLRRTTTRLTILGASFFAASVAGSRLAYEPKRELCPEMCYRSKLSFYWPNQDMGHFLYTLRSRTRFKGFSC